MISSLALGYRLIWHLPDSLIGFNTLRRNSEGLMMATTTATKHVHSQPQRHDLHLGSMLMTVRCQSKSDVCIIKQNYLHRNSQLQRYTIEKATPELDHLRFSVRGTDPECTVDDSSLDGFIAQSCMCTAIPHRADYLSSAQGATVSAQPLLTLAHLLITPYALQRLVSFAAWMDH